jgi:hypothetical protein
MVFMGAELCPDIKGGIRVFVDRVLRRVCGPKRDEVMGEWRILHNVELCKLCALQSVIRMMKLRIKWARFVG